jgi:TetR/AcrR family transcriptional regulator
MRAIAEDAGITIQLLTHHVKSKENLWKIVVEHLREQYAALRDADPELPPDASAAERLRMMIADIVHFTATVPQLHRLMTLEAAQLTPRLIYLIETFAREPFNDMCALIQQGQRDGTVRAANPQRLRFAIMGMAAVPFSVAAEYEFLTGKNPFLKPEIEHTIELIDDLIFTQRE